MMARSRMRRLAAAAALAVMAVAAAVVHVGMPARAAEGTVTDASVEARLVSGAEDVDGKLVYRAFSAEDRPTFVYRVSFNMSGEGTLPPNAVRILVPNTVLLTRDGKVGSTSRLPVPSATEYESMSPSDAKEVTWVYDYTPDFSVIRNVAPISAAQHGFFDIKYTATVARMIADFGSDKDDNPPFCVSLRAADKRSTAETPALHIDTTATVVVSAAPVGKIYHEWDDRWGDAPDDGKQIYIVWEGVVNVLASQPFVMTLASSPRGEKAAWVDRGPVPDGMLPGVDVVGYRVGSYGSFKPDGVFKYTSDGGRKFVQVLTRQSRREWEEIGGTPVYSWSVVNPVTVTVHPADGVDPDTSQLMGTATASWEKPAFHIPTGRFRLRKFGWQNRKDDEAPKHIKNADQLLSSPDLGVLRDGRVGETHLMYCISAGGLHFPWTSSDPSGVSGDIGSYGSKPVTYEVTDDSLWLVPPGAPSFSHEEWEENDTSHMPSKLSHEDYDIAGVMVSASSQDIPRGADGRPDISTSSDPLPAPPGDIEVHALFNGEWRHVATVSPPADPRVLDHDVVGDAQGGELMFAPGVDGVRLRASNPLYSTDMEAFVYVSLFGTDGVRAVLNQPANRDRNRMLLVNKADMKVTKADGEAIFSKSRVIGNQLVDGQATSQLLVSRKHESSYDGVRQIVRNNIQASFMERRTTSLGTRLVPQEGGTFMTLLPPGAFVDPTTVRVDARTEDNGIVPVDRELLSVDSFSDWRGSGRQMVRVHAATRAMDFSMNFDVVTPYDSVPLASTTIPVAYETGNPAVADGHPDNGGLLDRPLDELMSDLDPDAGRAPRFVYNILHYWLDAPVFYGTAGLRVDARSDRSVVWTDSTSVTPGEEYSYRMRYQAAPGDDRMGVILFDSIEAATRDDAPGEAGWHGTLKSVDVSHARAAGADPVVYLSEERLDPAEHGDPASDPAWVREDEFRRTHGDSIAAARSVAVDMGRAEGGGEFTLREAKAVSASLVMEAPSGNDVRVVPGSRLVARNDGWARSRPARGGDATTVRHGETEVELELPPASVTVRKVVRLADGSHDPTGGDGRTFEFGVFIADSSREELARQGIDAEHGWIVTQGTYDKPLASKTFFLKDGEEATFDVPVGAKVCVGEEPGDGMVASYSMRTNGRGEVSHAEYSARVAGMPLVTGPLSGKFGTPEHPLPEDGDVMAYGEELDVTFTNTRLPKVTMPMTGGPGVPQWVAAGVVVAVAAAATFGLRAGSHRIRRE